MLKNKLKKRKVWHGICELENTNWCILKIIFILFLFFAVVSCVEPYDMPDIEDASPQYVIYGYITSDEKRHSVRITRSAGFFSTQRPEGVSAVVTITDSVTLNINAISPEYAAFPSRYKHTFVTEELLSNKQ